MNALLNKSALVAAGVLLTLGSGSAALADDTEILTATPAARLNNRPNMLFIADTSGSMGGLVSSEIPYNSTIIYPGVAGSQCDVNRVYWNPDSNQQPDCTLTNTAWFNVSALVCDQATDAMSQGGYYTDIFAQYYASGGGSARWQEIANTQKGAMVECFRDSGNHGDGVDNSRLYAKRGATGEAFTNQSTESVAWGSSPTHRPYTVYSGNYLNWLNNPPSGSPTKIQIVRDVLRNLFSTLQDTNAGLARFNGNGAGGTILEGIKNLDAAGHRDDLRAASAALPASGVTPLGETLYEMQQYWTGRGRWYGYGSTTDTEILSGSNYIEPTSFECTKNFQILLSDGSPVSDYSSVTRTAALPGFQTITGNAICTGVSGNTDTSDNNGLCMDDIAAYLAPPDETDDALIAAKQTAGVPNVTTYTIGFDLSDTSTAVQRLRETAARGKGQYYPADDLGDLENALREIQRAEAEGEVTFTSPSVAVNSFNRTRNLDDLYFTVFEAASKVHWPGNLKRYRLLNGQIVDRYDVPAVGADGFFLGGTSSFWSTNDGGKISQGGAANQLPPIAARRVLTNAWQGGTRNALTTVVGSNQAAFVDSDLGITGASGDPTLAELLDWTAGLDTRDADEDGSTTDLRFVMGDPLHSQPASVVYGGTPANPDGLVFFGTNDGFLHAVDMRTGVEEWSFVPAEFLEDQNALYQNTDVPYKHYGVDGNIVPIIFDKDLDGQIETADGDYIYIVFGMRRGGKFLMALDVTNRANPSIRWRLDATDLAGLGQTWSTPVPARVKVGDGTQQSPQSNQIVLLFGAGYDVTHDVSSHPAADDAEGAGIFMVDVYNGNLLWAAGQTANGATSQNTIVARMNRSIPAALSVIDITADGLADRIYAADMGGQILRFDLFNGQTGSNFANGGVIARLGAEGLGSPTLADTRRFYNTPDVTLIRDPDTLQRFLNIGIGSGYRAHPLDLAAADKFYAVRDSNVFTTLTQAQYDSFPIITEADLVLVDRTSSAAVTIPAGKKGWMLPMRTGEKVLSSARTFQGTTFFTTYDPAQSSTDPCTVALGINRLYRVDPATASPFLPDGPADPADDDVRSVDLNQAGIVSDPVIIFGDNAAPQPVDPPRPPGCDPNLSDLECACLDDPTLPQCSATSCENDPNIASAVVCVANFCTSLPACLRPVRTIWSQEGVE